MTRCWPGRPAYGRWRCGLFDAIHLASALTLRDQLTTFVAYDKRLVAAAKEAGLPTASPA